MAAGVNTTKITELVTALGMLGGDHPHATLPARPGELRNVDDATWAELIDAWQRPEVGHLVDAAFANGRYFAEATDALRGRRPRLIEWTGPQRSPGDEVAPVDLRVDHVYLVSCKYLSKITMNASPTHLFERLLTGGQGRRGSDWYRAVAPQQFATLWSATRSWLADHHPDLDAPTDIDDLSGLSKDRRRAISAALRGPGGAWPAELQDPYRDLVTAVAAASAERWRTSILEAGSGTAEAMLWRLLRIGSAPYFVLGSAASTTTSPLRMRVASPWDWRQQFRFRQLEIEPLPGGQAMVRWTAQLDELTPAGATVEREVVGHVEIRWSHGRFSGPPEAKVYLDTAFDRTPGYWPIV